MTIVDGSRVERASASPSRPLDRIKVGALWRPSDVETEVIAQHWPAQVEFLPSTRSGTPLPIPERRDEVDVVVGLPFYLDADVLADMTHLRLIHALGHGIDALREPAILRLLEERGIQVARTDSASIPVAEYVVMAMVALARGVFPLRYGLLQHGSWGQEARNRRMQGGLGGEISGKRCLIVGYGGIGRQLAPRAKALGLHVTVARRHPSHDPGAAGVDDFVSFKDLDAELPLADHIVICAPLVAETRRLLDASRIAQLRPSSVVINVSRPALVDEAALLRALTEQRVGGAALDVWAHEDDPSVDLPGRSWQEANLIASPHISGLTREARLRSLAKIGEELRRFRDGERLENLADLGLGY